jgi:APA family basic amino acid/polyamine antiporter
MMASLERMTWIRLVAWLAIGLLIFFGYSRAHSKIARQLGASVAGGKAQPKPAQ